MYNVQFHSCYVYFLPHCYERNLQIAFQEIISLLCNKSQLEIFKKELSKSLFSSLGVFSSLVIIYDLKGIKDIKGIRYLKTKIRKNLCHLKILNWILCTGNKTQNVKMRLDEIRCVEMAKKILFKR